MPLTDVERDMVALRDRVCAPAALCGERVYDRASPWNVASDDPRRLARSYGEDALRWLTALARWHDPAAVMR